MKNKKVVLFVIGLMILFSVSSLAETKKLKQIGQYTLVRIKGEVPTSEIMKVLLDKYAGDIKYGFDLVGYGDLYLPFMDQIKSAEIEEENLPIGTKFMWMFFRSHGKVKVVEDLEWAGTAPLPVYVFHVKKNNKLYEFVMPKPCGNIALVSVKDIVGVPVCDIDVYPEKANVNDVITVDMSNSKAATRMVVDVFDAQGQKVTSKELTMANPKWQTSFSKPGKYDFKPVVYNLNEEASTNPCEATCYINHPPNCLLKVYPEKVQFGKTVTLDATGSEDPDGEINQADFEIMDEEGNILAQQTVTDKPYVWSYVVEHEGKYTAKVIVTDDFGALSGPCDAMFEGISKRFFFLVEAGGLIAKGTYTSYAFGRLGFMYMIKPDSVSFILSAGGAYPLVGGDLWKPFFMANALFNLHFRPAFIGAGIGYSTAEQDERGSGLDLVANIGVDLFPKGSIFFEGRFPVGGENREIADTHKLLLGFRLIF
ncbi:MAG: hypothetical protein JXB26_05640 [Candidatus Aminicenantes bacterium]|nr:hypothetical protein [Candidatus Aminicenantes bacterium]